MVERFHGKKEVMGSIPIFGLLKGGGNRSSTLLSDSLVIKIFINKNMASKKPFVKLQCEVCKRINYFVSKSKGESPKGEQKLELKKFCRWCRKHTLHKEGKK